MLLTATRPPENTKAGSALKEFGVAADTSNSIKEVFMVGALLSKKPNEKHWLNGEFGKTVVLEASASQEPLYLSYNDDFEFSEVIRVCKSSGILFSKDVKLNVENLEYGFDSLAGVSQEVDASAAPDREKMITFQNIFFTRPSSGRSFIERDEREEMFFRQSPHAHEGEAWHQQLIQRKACFAVNITTGICLPTEILNKPPFMLIASAAAKSIKLDLLAR